MTCPVCKLDKPKILTFHDGEKTQPGQPIVCRNCCSIGTVDEHGEFAGMTQEQARLFAGDRPLVERVAQCIIAINVQKQRRHLFN